MLKHIEKCNKCDEAIKIKYLFKSGENAQQSDVNEPIECAESDDCASVECLEETEGSSSQTSKKQKLSHNPEAPKTKQTTVAAFFGTKGETSQVTPKKFQRPTTPTFTPQKNKMDTYVDNMTDQQIVSKIQMLAKNRIS